MRKNVVICLSALVLLVLGGFAGGAGAEPVVAGNLTNVAFYRMVPAGDIYVLEPVPTLYTGVNDYGRLTFSAAVFNLSKGDYALGQITPEGTNLIQTMSIVPIGKVLHTYTILKLEVQKDQLAVPLEIVKEPAASGASAGNVTGAAAQSGPTAAASVPAGTKAPLSPLTILAGIGIAGVACALYRRR